MIQSGDIIPGEIVGGDNDAGLFDVSIGGSSPFLKVPAAHGKDQYFSGMDCALAFLNPDAPVIVSRGFKRMMNLSWLPIYQEPEEPEEPQPGDPDYPLPELPDYPQPPYPPGQPVQWAYRWLYIDFGYSTKRIYGENGENWLEIAAWMVNIHMTCRTLSFLTTFYSRIHTIWREYHLPPTYPWNGSWEVSQSASNFLVSESDINDPSRVAGIVGVWHDGIYNDANITDVFDGWANDFKDDQDSSKFDDRFRNWFDRYNNVLNTDGYHIY